MKRLISGILLSLVQITSLAAVSELTPAQVFEQKDKLRVIDVRTPEEFSDEAGHIDGAQLITLGEELTKFLRTGDRKERIVFVCRSGKRSAKATEESMMLGYEMTHSMKGGMLEWIAQGLPTLKE